MKLNRTYLFIACSSIALIVVLAIQINWILQTAKIKENFFNEKANMVLTKTAEVISKDEQACRQMGESLAIDSMAEFAAILETGEAHKIDSLLKYYMNYYNLHLDYSFKIIKPSAVTSKNGINFAKQIQPNQIGSYKKSLAAIANENGLELKLIFPDKKQYILAEMGTQFITSVLLILIVLVLFWRTILSLMNEKKIAEHTTDFLNNMTHEFKTPLTNIALAGKMMIKESSIREEEKIKHYSGIILEENERLRLQIEQVLSMTALERGEIPLQKTELDFHQLIHDAIRHIKIQVENRQGELRLNLNAEQFVVMGDKTHLTNALCNLIDNAIKYSKKNPELDIQTYNDGESLVLKIADRGIGIEKEYQRKVFEKYFRVPTGDVHDVKGFGLGLAYIKKIIELHRGSIVLQSEKNIGTTITLTLPNA